VTTNIRIDVLLRRLTQQVSDVVFQNRQAKEERESATLQSTQAGQAPTESVVGEINGKTLTVKESREQSAKQHSAVPDTYKQRRPAAQRGGTSYWILAAKTWGFEDTTKGSTPWEGANDVLDLVRSVRVQIVGQSGNLAYTTAVFGGDTVNTLLNEQDPSEDDYYGFPLLPAGTTKPSGPYVDQMARRRLTTNSALGGSAELNPNNYVVTSDEQLVIIENGSVAFYKPFFNVVYEATESCKLYFATQPRKLALNGAPVAKPATYHGNTLDNKDTVLFDVNHTYLVGRNETANRAVKPFGTSSQLHFFVNRGIDKSGLYQTTGTNTSRFQVGQSVYCITGITTEGAIGQIQSISKGSFSYATDDDPLTPEVTVSGTRVVVSFADSIASALVYFQLQGTTIVRTFDSVELALASNDSYWENRFGLLGGFANEWVVSRIQGQTLSLPQSNAAYIGDTGILYEDMDCSKAGKAYFYQAGYIQRDQPAWNRQLNYHDGDTVAQRPYVGTNDTSDYIVQYMRVVFIELDCATNSITNRTENIGVVSTLARAGVTALMPSWFPSKRYRQAGWQGVLNLTSDEKTASRLELRYDPVAEKQRRYIRSWSVDQSSIEAAVVSLQSEADYTEVEITDSYPVDSDVVEIGDLDGPSRFGYVYSTDYFVSA